MQIDNNSNFNVTSPSKIKNTYNTVKENVMKAVDAVDRYTSPREESAGNFEKSSYFQAMFQGAQEGFSVLGPFGILQGSIPSGLGVLTANKTGKWQAGVAVGCAAGVALGMGISMFTGASLATAAITGGLMGTMTTFRGDKLSATRDGAGNANMISAPFIKGPAKLAAGIGSAIGTKVESKKMKALVGSTVAGIIGGVLAAVGFAPVGIPVAIAASAAGGALGPYLGPRYSQFFRNLSVDIGKGVEKGLKKVGLVKEDQELGTKKSVIGAIPSSFLKEAVRGYALSDGNLLKTAISGVCESVEQAHIFLKQKKNPPQENPAQPDPHITTPKPSE